MKALAPFALLLTLLPAAAVADESDFPYSDSREYPFAAGGTVRLDLSAGGYDLRRGDDTHVRISWSTRTKEQLEDVRIDTVLRGKEISIETNGPRSNFRVVIELPARSHLDIRMSAGDLKIQAFEGNKDIRLRAGDLDVDIGPAERYRYVEASVTVGDLNARPFGVSKGGLWRSFTHEGSGPYTLHASLMAGDLTLHSREGVEASRSR